MPEEKRHKAAQNPVPPSPEGPDFFPVCLGDVMHPHPSPVSHLDKGKITPGQHAQGTPHRLNGPGKVLVLWAALLRRQDAFLLRIRPPSAEMDGLRIEAAMKSSSRASCCRCTGKASRIFSTCARHCGVYIRFMLSPSPTPAPTQQRPSLSSVLSVAPREDAVSAGRPRSRRPSPGNPGGP